MFKIEEILMSIPAGNGYNADLLNKRAKPHLAELGYDISFSSNETNLGLVKITLRNDEAQKYFDIVSNLLEKHYGLVFKFLPK